MKVIFGLMSGGGLVALFQAFWTGKKTKSDITEGSVKTAMELESKAMARYAEIETKLKHMEEDFIKIKLEMNVMKVYNKQLRILLKHHNIEIPDYIEGIMSNGNGHHKD
jgi:hypothetical protein